LADLDEAEAVLTRVHLVPFISHFSLRRAEIFWMQGEARRCFSAARRAARLLRERRLPILDWHARLLAAQALTALGRHGRAERLVTAFLADEQAPQLPWLAQTAHHLLGQMAEARGDLPAAADQYSRAMTALEAVSSRMLMDLHGHFLADKLAVYRDAVAVCLARDDLAGAYQCAERARGRALVEHLAGHVDIRPRARSADDEPLVEELTALRRERSRLATLVGQGQGQPGNGAPAGLSPAAARRWPTPTDRRPLAAAPGASSGLRRGGRAGRRRAGAARRPACARYPAHRLL
jgi:hypothetical protein